MKETKSKYAIYLYPSQMEEIKNLMDQANAKSQSEFVSDAIRFYIGYLQQGNSYRTVTISQQAIEVLKEQKKKTNDTYVFPSPNGGPISPDSVNNMLKRVLERAGIPKVRFHDLRHTFATIALQNGVDIKTVSGMLGHFSAGFTLDTYAHVTTSAQKEAAQTMGNVLSV